jgi:hypothetical protein
MDRLKRLCRAGLVAAGACMLPGALAADPPASFIDLFRAATQAHDAQDYAGMKRLLKQALELRPAHPGALYNLAAAQGLAGDRRGALETLELLARMGLVYSPQDDADFKAFTGSERFDDVLKEFRRNAKSAGRASTAFQVFLPDFIPEGLAYDPDERTYYIGSVHQRQIKRIVREGKPADFVPPGGGGLWAALGMTVDARRRVLWVATAAIPQMQNAQEEELGRSAIIGFDLASGARKYRFLLDGGKPGHVLGDLAQTRNGMVYATDSKAGVLYELNPSNGQFTALTQPGQLASPQGVTVSAHDQKLLYIADHTQGLYRFDIDKRELKRLDVEPEICVYGVDGLYAYGDDLIAVQNGIKPHRVVQFELDRRGRRVEHASVLASSLPEFDEPTLGVIVGRRFNFVANSQWGKFDAQHRLPPREQLKSPVVLRIALDERQGERRRDDDRSRFPSQQQPGPSQGLPVPDLPPIRP